MTSLLSIFFGICLHILGVCTAQQQQPRSLIACPYTESSYFMSDVSNRCVFYWCVKGQWVLPRAFQCAPGTGTRPGYRGYSNPCTEHVTKCSTGSGHFISQTQTQTSQTSQSVHHGSQGGQHGNHAGQPVHYVNQGGQQLTPTIQASQHVHHANSGGQQVQQGNGAQQVHYANQGSQQVQQGNQGSQQVHYANQGGQQVHYANQGSQLVQHGTQGNQQVQQGNQGSQQVQNGFGIVHSGHYGGQNKGHYHHGDVTGPHSHGGKPYGTHHPVPDHKHHPVSPKIVYKLDGYHVPFGDIIKGIYDVNQCLHSCLKNTSCHGFDFNFRYKTCWFHTQYTVCTNPVAKLDCAHFKLVHCPSTSTSAPPTTTQVPTNPTQAPQAVFPDMCISGGLSQPFFTTEMDCQNACVGDPGCEGIDFVQSTGSCFFHSSGTECGVLTPQIGCVHYRYVDCASGTLMAFPATHALGGIIQPALTDPADCITSCQSNTNCVAIDYDSNSRECFFHDAVTCSAVTYKLDCVHIRLQNCP